MVDKFIDVEIRHGAYSMYKSKHQLLQLEVYVASNILEGKGLIDKEGVADL